MKTMKEYIEHRIAIKQKEKTSPYYDAEMIQFAIKAEITELEHIRDMLKFYENPTHQEYMDQVKNSLNKADEITMQARLDMGGM